MNATICFSVCSMFYSVLLLYIFKKENNEKNQLNNMFKLLVIFNFVGLVLDILMGLVLRERYNEYRLLCDILLKMIPLYHIIWGSLFVLYVSILSNEPRKISKKIYIMASVIVTIVSIVNLFLPFEVKISNGAIMYSYGVSINYVFGYSLICYILSLIIMFKNFSGGNKAKYAPLFALISGGTIITMIQSVYPEWLLSVSMHTFVMYIAYINIRRTHIELLINKKGDK